MIISAEKELVYLLKFMDEYIEQMLYEVLNDSEEDPEYSAVAASNLIKCYSKVRFDIGLQNCDIDVRDYMSGRCFSLDEIESFEQKREKEAKYYRGEQF